MRYVFIINPISGKGKAAQTILPKIEEYFKDRELEYTVHITTYQREGVRLAKSEAQKGDDVRIFACGGDGTTFDVLNGIVGFDNAELCVIPGGSGNDFLRYFDTADDFSKIEELVDSKSYPVDIIKVGDWYALNVCSMGMDAEICKAKDKFLKWKFVSGEMAYKLACIHCFISKIKSHFKITTDDGEIQDGEFLFALGANAKFYGGGFKAAPEASVTDGYIDCMTIKTVSRLKIPRLLGVYRRGEHLPLDICNYKKVKKMTVECEKDATVNMDGEIITARKIDFEVVPKGIKFVIPSSCKEALKEFESTETVLV